MRENPTPESNPPDPSIRPRKRRWWPVVILFLAAAAAWVGVFAERGVDLPAPGEPGYIAWGDDLDAAAEASRSTGKPMLVLFTADWCPPCNTLSREVLHTPDVADAIERAAVPVKIDLTDPGEPENAAQRRFGVVAVPTLVLLGPGGETLERTMGLVAADELTGWLPPAEPDTPPDPEPTAS